MLANVSGVMLPKDAAAWNVPVSVLPTTVAGRAVVELVAKVRSRAAGAEPLARSRWR